MACGIYAIVNKNKDKWYLGSSKDIHKRFARHLWELRQGVHHSVHLQRAFNKYGEGAFELQIVEYCLEEDLLERESLYLGGYHPDIYYNVSECASGGDLLTNHPDRENIIERRSAAL